MYRLDNKVVVITGAARGLGKATVPALVEQGATVVAIDLKAEELVEATQEFPTVKAYPADLSDIPQLEPLVADIISEFKQIDVLINNAAICQRIPFCDLTEEEWDREMAINAKSNYFLSQHVCRAMKVRGKGKIINVTSASGQFGSFAGASSYSGTKGAQIAFSKSIAKEVVGDGITVNLFCPGTMLTDQILSLPKSRQEEVREMLPMKRMTSPEEMAPSLVFMCTDECSYANGATFDFNGGVVMR